MLTKWRFRRALESDFHRKRQAASVLRVMVVTTPDILTMSDDSVFTEHQPPYDQEAED